MKKYIYTFLFCLFTCSITLACSCIDYVYFCESTTENSHVVRAEIINKYETQGTDEFDSKSYMDVLIVENILGVLTVDTISIVNYFTSCDLTHTGFEIGDEVILNNIDEDRIDDFSGHPYVSPGGCSSTILTLNEDGVVEGAIRSDLSSQSFDEFTSEIGVCSELTTLDRWIERINERIYLFPNPSSTDVFVFSSLPIEEEGFFELYDAAGQLMHQGLMDLRNQLTIRVSDYPRGVYFLKIKIRDQFLIRKILKN